MAIVEQTSGGPAVGGEHQGWIRANWGLLLATAVLAIILLLPTPEGLPVAGHRMLAILGFAVIVWMTEAHRLRGFGGRDRGADGVSAGAGAQRRQSQGADGHERRRWRLAFSGFANTALVLVAAALFLAAAMTATGLDKRIALTILSRVGTETRNVVIGTIVVGFVIALHGAFDHRARGLLGADYARHHPGLRRRRAAAPLRAC